MAVVAWLAACGKSETNQGAESFVSQGVRKGQVQDNPMKRGVVTSKPHRFASKSKQTTPEKTLHFDWSEPEEEEKKDEPSDPEAKRNYEQELRALVGDPSGCITAEDAEAAPTQVTVHFAATVSSQGIITRVEASSTGLPERAIGCLTKRLDTARFKPVVEDAPRRVEATLTLGRQPKPTE